MGSGKISSTRTTRIGRPIINEHRNEDSIDSLGIKVVNAVLLCEVEVHLAPGNLPGGESAG